MKYSLILGNNFEEIEAVTAIDLLRRAGVTVDTYGVGSDSIKGRSNLTVKTDRILNKSSDINTSEYDGILLPGGPGAQDLAKNEIILKIIQDFNKENKLIYAICAAPLILDKAGVLKDKKYTCYPGTAVTSGQRLDERIVKDGNIITSQGVGTALDAAIKLVEIIVSPEEAKQQALKTLYHN